MRSGRVRPDKAARALPRCQSRSRRSRSRATAASSARFMRRRPPAARSLPNGATSAAPIPAWSTRTRRGGNSSRVNPDRTVRASRVNRSRDRIVRVSRHSRARRTAARASRSRASPVNRRVRASRGRTASHPLRDNPPRSLVRARTASRLLPANPARRRVPARPRRQQLRLSPARRRVPVRTRRQRLRLSPAHRHAPVKTRCLRLRDNPAHRHGQVRTRCRRCPDNRACRHGQARTRCHLHRVSPACCHGLLRDNRARRRSRACSPCRTASRCCGSNRPHPDGRSWRHPACRVPASSGPAHRGRGRDHRPRTRGKSSQESDRPRLLRGRSDVHP